MLLGEKNTAMWLVLASAGGLLEPADVREDRLLSEAVHSRSFGQAANRDQSPRLLAAGAMSSHV